MMFTLISGVHDAILGSGRFPLFEARQAGLILNTLAVSTGATCIALATGVPLSVFMDRTDMPGRDLFRIIYLLPVLVPPVIQTVSWTRIASSLTGVFPIDIYSVGGCAVILGMCYFPFVTLMTLSGLRSVDRDIEEVALLWHGGFRVCTRITLPVALPHIASGAILVFMLCAVNFTVPDILRVRVYPVEIFVQYSAFYNGYGALLQSLPLVSLLILLLWGMDRMMQGRAFVQAGMGRATGPVYSLGGMRWPVCCLCASVFVMAVVLPLAELVRTTGSFHVFRDVVVHSIPETIYTVMVAFCGTVLSIATALPAAYLADRLKNVTAAYAIGVLNMLPLTIPATAFGLSLVEVWNQSWLHSVVCGSSVIVILGYAGRFLPYAFAAMASGMKQISPDAEEVASLVSPSHARIFKRIVLPLLAPGMFAGFVMVFILSLGELGTTLLVLPPGRETVILKIYNLMHYGAHAQVAALSLFLLLIIGLFFVFALLSYRYIWRGH